MKGSTPGYHRRGGETRRVIQAATSRCGVADGNDDARALQTLCRLMWWWPEGIVKVPVRSAVAPCSFHCRTDT